MQTHHSKTVLAILLAASLGSLAGCHDSSSNIQVPEYGDTTPVAQHDPNTLKVTDNNEKNGDTTTPLNTDPSQTTDNSLKNGNSNTADTMEIRLEKTFYLDPADAKIIVAKAADPKNSVLKANVEKMLNAPEAERIFHGTKPSEFEFVSPKTNPTPGYIQDNWTPDLEARFKRVFGQVMFLYNTPEFQRAFDDNANYQMLDKATQGQPGPFNTPMPNSFADLRDASLQITEHHKLKVVLSGSKTGFDYGMTTAKDSTNPVTMTVEADSLSHKGYGQVSLVAHEFSHTWGYAHDPNKTTMLKPNNTPYYIQFIMGYNQDLIALCGDSECHAKTPTDSGAPHYFAGASNSIQAKYFDDTF